MVVVELAKFNLNKSITEEEFMNASEAMQKDVSRIKGFIKRRLIKDPEGKWADLIFWETMEDVQKAFDEAMKMEGPQKYFPLMDESSIEMNHFEVIKEY